MAKRGSESGMKGPQPAPRPVQAQFDFAAILGIADALPMAIGFVDPTLTYRFCNRAYAELFDKPRGEIIGRSLEQLLPEAVLAPRRPLLQAALRGERQWFASDYQHPSRGLLAVQSEYLPQTDAG